MTVRKAKHSKRDAPGPARRSRARGTLPPASVEDLPRDLLDRPSPEGARWLALLRLGELRAAHRKLVDDGGDDGVHRFRVGLRRLRGTLRELRPLLDDSVGGKTRRRLRDLAAAAGARRDLDVHLAWLEGERATLPDSEHPGVDWLEHALRREWHDADGALRHALDRDYERVVRLLDRRLRRYRLTIQLGKERPIATTRAELGGSIERLVHELESEAARVRSIEDDRAIHRTRIAAKRLRYVIEPLAARAWRPAAVVRAARETVSELKAIQNELGFLHDAHVLAAWLADRAAESAAGAARETATVDAAPGGAEKRRDVDASVSSVVRTLQHRLRDRASQAWSAIDPGERRARFDRLVARAHSVARRLSDG